MPRKASKQGKHSRILSLTKEAEVSKDVVSIQINIFSNWEAGKDYMLLVFSFWELAGTVFIFQTVGKKIKSTKSSHSRGGERGKILPPIMAGFQGKKKKKYWNKWFFFSMILWGCCVWSQAFNRPIYNPWGLGKENVEMAKSAKLFRLVQMKWDCDELWWDLNLGIWGTWYQMKFSADKYMVIDIRSNNLITAF